MLKFREIEIKDIDICKRFVYDSGELSCENAFVNLLIWKYKYHNKIAVCDDMFFIKSGEGFAETFRIPFGNDMKKAIGLIEEYCGNKKPRFWGTEGPALDRFCEIYGEKYCLKENIDAQDYIYLQSDLAELKGKKYHSKRNHISAFSKRYEWRYEAINENNIEAVRLCAEKWYSENGDRLDSTMKSERFGVEIMLNSFERLHIKGGAIFVDDSVVAFTLGSAISDEVFDIHIEKALQNYAEGYAVINREFAKNELGGYKYINREDDLGIEGLRRAKLSYKPVMLLKKYYCATEYCDVR